MSHTLAAPTLAAPKLARPTRRPARPFFSCGPCAKHPGYSIANLEGALLGRSHRSPAPKARLAEVIDRSRTLLGMPTDWRLGIVPASDTGAMEMAMWSLLGPLPVDVVAFESFSAEWATDALSQLPIRARHLHAPFGELPDVASVDPNSDLVFTWNGTTSGVRVPNANFIAADRKGLSICDATSAAFAMEMDWDKLDVVTWSWQKVLGGEAQHGMIALSPRAIERLRTYTPPWPLPKIFRLVQGGKLLEGIFAGETINTPSMLCVEDVLSSLRWAERIGGLPALIARSQANYKVMADWVERTSWVEFLAKDPAIRTTTSMCFTITEPGAAAAITKRLADEAIAYDIASYREAPPGLRIWGGSTVDTADLADLLPWIGWAREAFLAGE